MSERLPDFQNPESLIQIMQYLPGINASVFHRLLLVLDRLDAFWESPITEIQPLLPPKSRQAYVDLRTNPLNSETLKQWQSDQLLLNRHGIEVVTWYDHRYPTLLKTIHEAPPVLYVRGDTSALEEPQLALVGSRNMTSGGAENALNFSRYLAQCGFTITSGLAAGIDAQAHRGALQARGKTVAVMATGIDRVYPARHKNLADEIVNTGGCLVTEYRPGSPPLARHFPNRNRIVSGLSLGVLVVEAALKSGSLITARLAMEQNREVFAIPGSIHNPVSRGCHELIRQGATLVESAMDIAEQLKGWVHVEQNSTSESEIKSLPKLTSGESELLKWLGFEFVTLDFLAEASGWTTEKLLAELMSLQIKGVIDQQGSGYQRL